VTTNWVASLALGLFATLALLGTPVAAAQYALFITGDNTSSTSGGSIAPPATKLTDMLGDRLVGIAFDDRGGLGYTPGNTHRDMNQATDHSIPFTLTPDQRPPAETTRPASRDDTARYSDADSLVARLHLQQLLRRW
jgi:hypothetical protein